MMGKLNLNGEIYPVFFSEDGNVYGVQMSMEQYERFKVFMPMIFEGEIVVDPKMKLNEFEGQFRLDRKKNSKSKII